MALENTLKKIRSLNSTEPKQFIKVVRPTLEDVDKSALNRKGIEAMNRGDFVFAEKIFRTTKNNSGLSQLGDHYFSKKNFLKSAEFYLQAGNQSKLKIVCTKIADTLQIWLDE